MKLRTIIQFLALLSVWSCTSQKKTVDKIVTEEKPNVEFSIRRYLPHCGGMAPREDRVYYEPEVATFVLIDLIDNKREDIKSDSTGKIKLGLKTGKYAIKQKFKDVSFEEFYKNKYQKGEEGYTKELGKECYKKWWKENLVEFEITDTTKTLDLGTITIYNTCFTNNNPCLEFIGPYPP